jgi:hypothetical protein
MKCLCVSVGARGEVGEYHGGSLFSELFRAHVCARERVIECLSEFSTGSNYIIDLSGFLSWSAFVRVRV